MPESSTNITDQHRHAFEALTDGQHSNFALFSCFVDGSPASAIVAVNEIDGEYQITSLFVSITPDMDIRDHEGTTPGGAA